MIHRFLIKLGTAAAIVGFGVMFIGFLMNGEIGRVAVSNRHLVYQTSFDQVILMDLPEWAV